MTFSVSTYSKFIVSSVILLSNILQIGCLLYMYFNVLVSRFNITLNSYENYEFKSNDKNIVISIKVNLRNSYLGWWFKGIDQCTDLHWE